MVWYYRLINRWYIIVTWAKTFYLIILSFTDKSYYFNDQHQEQKLAMRSLKIGELRTAPGAF